jgi:hypothetical protein
MDKLISLWSVYWITYFAVISELEDWTFKWKIIDTDEKLFYDPNIVFSYYDICLQNLKDRLMELARKEASEINL